MKAWLQAARPLAHANIAPPLLFGQALAYATSGTFDVRTFALVQLFGLFDHLFIVFANDAADYRVDMANTTYNRYSGGSRVVPEGKLVPRQLATASMFALLAMATLSMYFVFIELRMFMLVVCAGATGLLWAYSFEPLKLSYRGAGEWVQALGVGVVLPFVGFYAQSGRFFSTPWIAFVPTLLLGYASNLTTGLPDTPSDRDGGKRTFSVRRGERLTRHVSVFAIAIACAVFPVTQGLTGLGPTIAAVAAPMALLLWNLRGLDKADSGNRAACERFVALNVAAIVTAQLSWAAVLVLRA
jgi:1,4-dihydroxy-2-naphthoate octaprenyltransferase